MKDLNNSYYRSSDSSDRQQHTAALDMKHISHPFVRVTLVAILLAVTVFAAAPIQAQFLLEKTKVLTRQTLQHLCQRYCGNHHHHHGHVWCSGHADYWCPGH